MVKTYLSSPKLLHYTMIPIMAYLIAGTVAQKYIGLYAATKLFFSDPILFVGVVPLPGFPIFLVILFINLAFKIIFSSPWTIQNSGIIITHLGAMLLLIGGMITAIFSHEGFIDLGLSQSKSYVEDYHHRVFAILDEEGNIIHETNHRSIQEQQTIRLNTPSIEIKIIETCNNCTISKRGNGDDTFHGMAQHMKLSDSTLRNTDEENMGGITFKVAGSENDGIYVVLEDVPRYPEIFIGDSSYRFALRKQRSSLPFNIELLNFERELYPGTQMAKSYASHVRITDGDSAWESVISMNEPLRYKGYSFFQSSFIAAPSGDISVLAVVWNAGRTFPYIAGLTMCIGLILHLILYRRRSRIPKV